MYDVLNAIPNKDGIFILPLPVSLSLLRRGTKGEAFYFNNNIFLV